MPGAAFRTRHNPVAAGFRSAVLADSPLIFLRLGEASTATAPQDSSGNAHHGSWVGGASVALAQASLLTTDSDTSARFNADGAYASVAHFAGMDVANFSVEFLVKGVDGSGNRYVASHDPFAAGANRQFLIQLASGQVVFTVADSGGTLHAFTGGTVSNAASTYHVVCTYDGTTQKIYVNNVASSTPLAITTGTSTSDMRVGAVNVNATGFTIDEFAYYTTALSAARVAAHYAAT